MNKQVSDQWPAWSEIGSKNVSICMPRPSAAMFIKMAAKQGSSISSYGTVILEAYMRGDLVLRPGLQKLPWNS